MIFVAALAFTMRSNETNEHAKHPMPKTPNTTHYVLILDDHPMVGRGMAQFLTSVQPDLDAKVCTQWDEVHAVLQEHGCPVLLVADVWLSSGSSLPVIAQWKAQNPGTPWLAISGDDDPSIAQRVRVAGAQGFIHKQESPATFGKAYAQILSGGVWFGASENAAPSALGPREWEVTPAELGLTLRQGDILILLLRGLPNKRIALMLNIAESTVKEHVTSILERFAVRTRVELITALRGRKVVTLP